VIANGPISLFLDRCVYWVLLTCEEDFVSFRAILASGHWGRGAVVLSCVIQPKKTYRCGCYSPFD